MICQMRYVDDNNDQNPTNYLIPSCPPSLTLYIPIPIPPIPGIPPPIPIPAGGPFSSASTTQHSEVVNNEATPEASTRAVRTTFRGSKIPAAIISLYWEVAASYPQLNFSCVAYSSDRSLPTTTDPSSPAFSTMVRQGRRMAFRIIETPSFWSKLSTSRVARWVDAFYIVSAILPARMEYVPIEQFLLLGRYLPQRRLG
jgi:hypothetical protein